MTSFEGKVALVTGAASGIGAAAARLLHARGAAVAIADRNQAGASALAAELGTRAHAITVDVADEPSVAAMVAETEATFGGLDILINNAGIEIGMQPLTEVAFDAIDRLMRINVIGIFLCLKHGFPALARRGGGAVVNTGSIAGMLGIPMQVAYSASKGAVNNMTRSAAMEGGAFNIRVNAVAPGGIDTPLMRGVLASAGIDSMPERALDRLAVRRVGQPEDIARMIAFLASDEASYITGMVYPVDGGMTAN